MPPPPPARALQGACTGFRRGVGAWGFGALPASLCPLRLPRLRGSLPPAVDGAENSAREAPRNAVPLLTGTAVDHVVDC